MNYGSILTFLDALGIRKLCTDTRYVLFCHGDEELLCGHGDIYRMYFCFYNHLELRLESRIHLPYVSLLLSYQVIHGVTQLWMKESQYYITIRSEPLSIIDVPVASMHWTHYIMQSYRYTMKTSHGFQLFIGIKLRVTTYTQSVLVSIYDGPILVKIASLYDLNKFRYLGGLTVTCSVNVVNTDADFEEGNEFLIAYQNRKQNVTKVELSRVLVTHFMHQ